MCLYIECKGSNLSEIFKVKHGREIFKRSENYLYNAQRATASTANPCFRNVAGKNVCIGKAFCIRLMRRGRVWSHGEISAPICIT